MAKFELGTAEGAALEVWVSNAQPLTVGLWFAQARIYDAETARTLQVLRGEGTSAEAARKEALALAWRAAGKAD
ncbi:hypothetical protein BKE38_00015 [Pseudoroseomonas deserti]|uniref:Uncharacterized protein n=1 Tax=Teichococcus deserti TaxID=1817963 RepID=A0A1V2H9P1_9PROT|nr:hypothetical protein [Pseudoroseomonas deserti]ONG59100.1 hypothetical protein BKE38_00015 [Pseudoroseomonas deserti]